MLEINRERSKRSIAEWQEEDFGNGDITTMTIIPVDRPAKFMSKKTGGCRLAGSRARIRRRRSRFALSGSRSRRSGCPEGYGGSRNGGLRPQHFAWGETRPQFETALVRHRRKKTMLGEDKCLSPLQGTDRKKLTCFSYSTVCSQIPCYLNIGTNPSNFADT